MKICYFIGDITTTGGIERVLSILTTEQSKDSEFDITIVSRFILIPLLITFLIIMLKSYIYQKRNLMDILAR